MNLQSTKTSLRFARKISVNLRNNFYFFSINIKVNLSTIFLVIACNYKLKSKGDMGVGKGI